MKKIKVTGYYEDTGDSHFLYAWQKPSDADGVAIFGNGGDDVILGVKGTGYDALEGGNGNDYLDGRRSGGLSTVGDHLLGGKGADTFILHAGDSGQGDAGRDTFVIHDGAGEHYSTIMDFDPATDKIQFGDVEVKNANLDHYVVESTIYGLIVGDHRHQTLLLGIYDV